MTAHMKITVRAGFAALVAGRELLLCRGGFSPDSITTRHPEFPRGGPDLLSPLFLPLPVVKDVLDLPGNLGAGHLHNSLGFLV